MRIAMLFSIMIYGVMIKFVPSNVQANPVIFYVIVLLAIWIVAALFLFQRKYVKASESVLARDSGDLLAQKRWRLGYFLTYAFSEAIALYGVVLHFLGFTAAQVAPFLIAGAVLILFYSPRLPVSSANS
jgi:F0F1-type ATP synthase membrane subunit c/vacuolar-type H+-ATPase subunit K